MAIKRIELYICDKCGNECNPKDGYRTATYDYYYDVGYSRVKADFSWNVPYGISNGGLCASCVDDAILKLAADITNKRPSKERKSKDAKMETKG